MIQSKYSCIYIYAHVTFFIRYYNIRCILCSDAEPDFQYILLRELRELSLLFDAVQTYVYVKTFLNRELYIHPFIGIGNL